MPYELFWHGPISAYLQYRAAYYKRQRDENRVAWLHGAYITRAIASAFDSKKNPYPEKPIVPLTPEQEKKKQEMDDMISAHNSKMQEIEEQNAVKLQRQLEEKVAKKHGGRADH
jgi:hypothetical protein